MGALQREGQGRERAGERELERERSGEKREVGKDAAELHRESCTGFWYQGLVSAGLRGESQ